MTYVNFFRLLAAILNKQRISIAIYALVVCVLDRAVRDAIDSQREFEDRAGQIGYLYNSVDSRNANRPGISAIAKAT
jgi:hypothetical protein